MTNRFLFPVPAVVGSLEAYVQTANRFPILTQEEELDYARRLKYEDDLEAAKHLILSHLRVVVAISRGYMGYGLPQADLIQEGNIGLMKAVRRFDPERGVRLVSFAVHWIRAEIHEFIVKNWRIVKIATTKAQRKLFFNLRSLKQHLGQLGVQEAAGVASELNVKPEEVFEMETRLSGHDIALEPPHDEEEEFISPIAYLESREPGPEAQLEEKQLTKREAEGLANALDKLDARSRRVIESRWLREKDAATLHELAGEFGVSAERIRQIEQKALAKMKTALVAVQERK
ncbi:MAG TPA: RNA polymerase sigma factor RpoH [Burkholderiales bacterium]|nr:RNA polymerase sigma factor RpoH [Burkholderiales bacterium]